MGELGPEGGQARRNQKRVVGGQAGTRGWASREERQVGEGRDKGK